MIRNLNPVSFKGFGTILPERNQSARLIGQAQQRQLLQLTRGEVAIYRTVEQTWAWSSTSGAVLSVLGVDGEYLHFYLDKPVQMKQGVTFYLSAMQEEATAEIVSNNLPEKTGTASAQDDYRVKHRLRVPGIYTFFYQEREKGFFFPGEAHTMWELTYVDQGSLHSVVEGQDTLLEQGDMTIYGPNQWHMQYADIEATASFVTITFDLEGGSLEGLLNRKFRVSQRAVSLLQHLLRELDRADAFTDDMIVCQLTQLLLVILRENGGGAEAKLRTENALNNENEIIRQAQQYISANIRNRLSVPIVAQHTDVSASYLTALFRKNLQLSPGEYIRRIKLQESKQMIREGNMNFTEIAYALQYSTVHHFSRQFKAKFGITPTEYARSIR